MTSYTVTAQPGNIIVTGTGSPIVVAPLVDGVEYTFTVTATNGAGTGSSSSASAPVVAGVPGAPTITSTTHGDRQATVHFDSPTSSGSSPITSYKLVSHPEGVEASGTTTPITVTGLSNGTSYVFTVVAVNTYGSSSASAPSTAVVPGMLCLLEVVSGVFWVMV